MTADLELTVLHEADGDAGYVAGFAITDQMLLAVGGTSNRTPTVLASSNAKQFEPRSTPRELGLRAALAVGDSIWACGEYGQLAVTRDHGQRWTLLETGTSGCLYSLALGSDGAIWVSGDEGYAARVLGEKVVRVEFGTTVRLSRVVAVRDEICALGFDGKLRRWLDGKVTEVGTGATKPLTGLVLTKGNWVVTGDGGFIGRSPDGTWFSRVASGVEVDLEAIAMLADGRLIVVGDRGQVLLSSDEGRTWKQVPNELGLVHLWTVKRFGGGVLIGGDEGVIVKLAPPGDATWSDRVDLFGGAKPLDPAFARGPETFLEDGLATYLAATSTGGEEEIDEGEGEDDEDEDDDDDDDADDDDEDDDDDDDDDGDDDAEGDNEAFSVLGEAGDADDFRDIYGVPLPAEVATFFTAVAGHDKWRTFDELRLDNDLRPDVGQRNLFELMVRRNQHAYLGTDLVEAFAGVFGIGSQGNGDTYHMEIYPWDEHKPRQVLHFDHETHSFSGVFSDSLDSLVYLAAIVKAGEARAISKEVYDAGIRSLRGKVTPTWHFSIGDKDPDWVNLEPKRRDTEFFFYRSRWITSLLKNDGVTDIDDLPQLFMADFNQVIPADQLPARYEACEKFIPTALYAMWRAFLFDEPELAQYLEIGRRHAARLVRDAARLIDDLRGGRNQLGTIKDVRAMLAAFRALDLDPRRAAQRTAEAEAAAKEEAARGVEATAELERTPTPQWPDLAWKWLDDGVAHRALLKRLDQGSGAAQIAAIDELGDLTDDERAAALPRLARELSSELEAVLVGSLVRDDRLAGVLEKPTTGGDEGGGGGDDDDHAPGWDAIDAALAPIYGKTEPLHFGTVMPYGMGGNDPIHGISVYARTDPMPHWHFVTYGFTDLFHKENEDPDESGFGFELTFRLARQLADDQPPNWSLNFLQNLGRYVFSTGNRFAAGHKMGLNGPIALDSDTQITAICFSEDPELTELTSEFGKAQFVQIVGITDDEYKLIQEWSTHGLIDILRKKLPFLVTDLHRGSVLADPEIAAEAEQRVAADGSSEDLTFAGELQFQVDDGRVRIELGALYAAVLPRAMRGRIRHGRPYTLRGRNAVMNLRPGSQVGYAVEDGELNVEITQELAREMEAQLRDSLAGTYDFEAWPALEIVVTPSFIRAQDGTATEVKGVADAERARELIAEENARLAAAAAEPEDEDEDDDEDEDEDDDEAEHDPDPERVTAALAMTSRALRLAPGDSDVQFTHGMLLLDAEDADELIAMLPGFVPSVRINIAVRMGKAGHGRFGEVVDLALSEALPERILSSSSSGAMMSFGDVAHELFGELGDAILEHVPPKLGKLVPLLPDDVNLLSELAYKAASGKQRDAALSLYDRILALPIPDEGEDRTNYLRAINNACVQAHAAKAYEAAARIADRAQPIAHENPYIYHSAACAYAALGDYAKALDQVRLAIEHEYEHVNKVEADHDLGQLLEWPEFKAMFRDWHARQEGN